MPSSIEVAELKPDQFEVWNNFVESSPQGSVFAKTTYLDACQADFNILACFRSDEIVGGIVLTRSKWGKYTNPLLCKYLGILLGEFEGSRYQTGTNTRKVQQLLLEQIGKKRRFEYMFHPGYTDWLPFHWNGYKQTTKYTYRIDLKMDQPANADYNSRLRGKINKAEKDAGFELLEDIDPAIVYDLMDLTFEHQKNKNPFNKVWLEQYVKTLAAEGNLMITALRNADGKITNVLGIVCDNHAHYLILNGVDHNHIQNGHNEWLIDQAINRAQKAGMKYFDFEGSMIKNVESFYRQFGGALTPYFVISR